jgi:hypothetical protein
MNTRKKWTDLTQTQRVAVIILSIVQLSLLGAALMDIYRRPPEQIRGSKPMWIALSFVNYFGPVAYFTYGIQK